MRSRTFPFTCREKATNGKRLSLTSAPTQRNLEREVRAGEQAAVVVQECEDGEEVGIELERQLYFSKATGRREHVFTHHFEISTRLQCARILLVVARIGNVVRQLPGHISHSATVPLPLLTSTLSTARSSQSYAPLARSVIMWKKR